MTHLTAVPDIGEPEDLPHVQDCTPGTPPLEPGTVVIGFGTDATNRCPDCDADAAYSPVSLGLERTERGRLCTNCADTARPGLGTLLDGIDQIDGVLACEADPNRRLVLLAELERSYRWLMDRWLTEEDA